MVRHGAIRKASAASAHSNEISSATCATMCMVTNASMIRPLPSRSLARTVCMSQLVISPPVNRLMIATPATPVRPRGHSRLTACHIRAMLALRPMCFWGMLYAPARIRRVARWRGDGRAGRHWAQPGKLPRIGILVLGNPDPASFLKEFREGLRELGYVEGQTIVFEFRSAAGDAQSSLSSPQNWSRSRSTSSSPFRPRPRRRRSRRPLKSRSSWRESAIRSAPASSPVWRGRAATSPACRAQRRNSEERTLNSSRGAAVGAPRRGAGQRAGSVSQALPRKHAGVRPALGLEIKPILLRGAEEIDAALRRDGAMAGRGRHRPAQLFRTSVSPIRRSSIACPLSRRTRIFPWPEA